MNPIRFAKNWISHQRTVAQLNNLPNHTLADIGLSRFDVRAMAASRGR